MKHQWQFKISLMLLMVLLTSCSTLTTDTIKLYPSNKAAEKWGVITYGNQYLDDSMPQNITINLPNNKQVSGQITFIEDSITTRTEGSYKYHHSTSKDNKGFYDYTPSKESTTRNDKMRVNINAFGGDISLNCRGFFNENQQQGTLDCKLTNGMIYRGTIRRTSVDQ